MIGKKISKYLREAWPVNNRLLLVGSILFLLAASMYIGLYASFVYSNIQDATIYPYIFRSLKAHDLILPASHANILKFPLFFLQANLPYNIATYTLVNISLLLVTVFGWSLGLGKLVGKKYLPLIFILTGGILLSSEPLGLNLIETTVRNIEYPVGLAFLFAIGYLLRSGTAIKRRMKYMIAVVCSVLALALAGDTLMLYGFVAPAILVLALYWLANKRTQKSFMLALAAVIATVVTGVVIRRLVAKTGLAIYWNSDTFSAQISGFNGLGSSFTLMLQQIMEIFGAKIFDMPAKITYSIYFLNFGLLLIGMLGLVTIITKNYRSLVSTQKFASRYGFVQLAVALSLFTTTGAYLVSGLVSTASIRYITLVPFILVLGCVHALANHQFKRENLWVVACVLVPLICVVSAKTIHQSTIGWRTHAVNTRAELDAIVKVLKENNVNQVLIGDSTGGPLRLRSSNTISYNGLVNCNTYFAYNTRFSWRKPDRNVKTTALIIDRLGFDRQYLGHCTDSQLAAIYATPLKRIEIDKPWRKEPIIVLVYNYDIRSKVLSPN